MATVSLVKQYGWHVYLAHMYICLCHPLYWYNYASTYMKFALWGAVYLYTHDLVCICPSMSNKFEQYTWESRYESFLFENINFRSNWENSQRIEAANMDKGSNNLISDNLAGLSGLALVPESKLQLFIRNFCTCSFFFLVFLFINVCAEINV